MKRWRPILLRVCVLLLLGAIINVAVAWGCVRTSIPAVLTWTDVDRALAAWTTRVVDAASDEAHSLTAFGWCPSEKDEYSVYSLLRSDHHSFGSMSQSYAEHCGDAPGYVTFSHPAPVPARISEKVFAGWPLLCLHGETWEVFPPAEHLVESQRIERSQVRRSVLTTRKHIDIVGCSTTVGLLLPYRPIWPGFAINTLFYAAILWLLFAAPLALRRRFRGGRIKRGLCPKCAYDLRGSVRGSQQCPECGATT